MGWLPETIDALTRMYRETGMAGLIVMAMMVAIIVLVVAIVAILVRNTGQLVGMGQAWITHTSLSNKMIIDRLDAISISAEKTAMATDDIKKSNNAAQVELVNIKTSNQEMKEISLQVKDRVNKLPSDNLRPEIKREEAVEIVRDAMVGMQLVISPEDENILELAIKRKKLEQAREAESGQHG